LNISIVRQAMPSAWPSVIGPSRCSTMRMLMPGKAQSWAASVSPAGPVPTISTSTSPANAAFLSFASGSAIAGSPARNPL